MFYLPYPEIVGLPQLAPTSLNQKFLNSDYWVSKILFPENSTVKLQVSVTKNNHDMLWIQSDKLQKARLMPARDLEVIDRT